MAGVSVDCTVFETSCVSTVCGWISSGKWAEEDLWLSWIFYHSVGLFFLTVPYRIKNKTTISNCSSLTCLFIVMSVTFEEAQTGLLSPGISRCQTPVLWHLDMNLLFLLVLLINPNSDDLFKYFVVPWRTPCPQICCWRSLPACQICLCDCLLAHTSCLLPSLIPPSKF